MNYEFLGKYILSGEIYCKTGLHIGGTTEGFEIGGVDNSVIRDPLTDLPYIPGSSLKGRLRHWLEWSIGSIAYSNNHKSYTAHNCGECDACILFGTAPENSDAPKISGPSRLTMRDAFPTEESKRKWKEWLGEAVYTEIKTENTLDRVTSAAMPRPMERVPAGSAFTFEAVLDVFQKDESARLMQALFGAMRLLEHSSLGGSGTRGHGQVEFRSLAISARPKTYYLTGAGLAAVKLPAKADGQTEVEAFIQQFSTIAWSF